jgi:hypothetical protein
METKRPKFFAETRKAAVELWKAGGKRTPPGTSQRSSTPNWALFRAKILSINI